MATLYIVEQSALAIGGHYFSYTQCVAKAALAEGLGVVILTNRRFVGDWGVPEAEIVPAFSLTWGEAEEKWIVDWSAGNIAFELSEALRGRTLRREDRILFHTLGYAELMAMLRFVVQLPLDPQTPTYDLLLRYDTETLRQNLEHYRPWFDRIAASRLLNACVRLHADTVQLAEDLQRLTGLDADVLPIPFQQEGLQARMAARAAEPEASDRPLVVTYLGDARLEKNYASLPAALRHLAPRIERGEVRFVLQSNFNTPGGEPGMLAAAQRLAQHPPSRVRLITEPMSQKDYYETLAEADVMVIPYDAERYQRRSSGILIEALCAEKPVVTTAGSWMASQVTNDHAVLIESADQLGLGIAEILDNYPRFSAAARARGSAARDHATGGNFVRSLFASSNVSQAEPSSGPRVLLVMNGDAMVLRNGASAVAATQMRYLESAGYAVCGLFIHYDTDPDIAAGEAWTAELRARLAPFLLERSFVAAPGRLATDIPRQRSVRGRWDYSIRNDIEVASNLDYNSELFRYLKDHAIDVVLLNYVTNYPLLDDLGLAGVPVVCDMIDVQSFQKAIYGRRAVTAADIALETSLLARSDVIVSLNEEETAYVRDILPDARIFTTGVFPPLKARSLGALAGACDLAEVVSSCQPGAGGETPPGAEGVARSFDPRRLSGLPSLDLLFVSSNHSANVSGLRWFINDVYLPLLADAGVTLLVAGSVAEVAGWPEHPNLHFIGRVETLDPLYAAARVVVLPIVEGAGSAVKTFEAMRYGAAIVATSVAMRGVGAVEGVAVADSPERFASAVLELLDSAEARVKARRLALAAAARLSDPAKYVRTMDEAFAAALGEHAPKGRAAPIETAARSDIEWDGPTQAANRLIRAWLEGGAFGRDDLQRLSAIPQAGRLIDELVAALVPGGEAPLLKTEWSVRKALTKPQVAEVIGSLGAVVSTLMAAIADPTPARFDKGAQLRIVAQSSSSLDLLAVGEVAGSAPSLEGDFGAGGLESAPFSLLDGRPLTRARFKAGSPEAPPTGLFSATISGSVGAVATQAVPMSVFRLSTKPGAATEAVVWQEGEVHDLVLPSLTSDLGGDQHLELAIRQPGVELEIAHAGAPLPSTQVWTDHAVIHRYLLPKPSATIGIGRIPLVLTALAGEATLLGARLRLVLGPDPALVLRCADRFEIADAHQAPEIKAETPDNLSAQLSEIVAKGGAVPRLRALNMLRKLHSGREAGEKRPSTLDAAAFADPSAAMGVTPGGLAFVASDAVSLWVEADFDPSSRDVGCEIDQTPAQPHSDQGASRTWRLAGRASETARWLRSLRFTGSRPSPTRCRLVWRFPAGLDAATGRHAVLLNGVHEPEMLSPEVGQTWIGPGPRATFGAPVALSGPARLVILVSNFGKVRDAEDMNLWVNGVATLFRMERHEDGGRISVELPESPDGPAITEIQLQVLQMFRPAPDPRWLGLAVQEIELSVDLIG